MEKLIEKNVFKNWKVWFRIPLTEYYIGWHYRLSLFRKKVGYKKSDGLWQERYYYFDKI